MHAQYSPSNKKKKHQLDFDESDDDSDDDGSDEGSDTGRESDNYGNHEPRVVSKTVDEKFTIDNVGEVSMQVQSRVTAIDFLNWRCNTFEIKDGVPDTCGRHSLWKFFIYGGDKDTRAFEHFLDMWIHFSGKNDEAASEIGQNSSAPHQGDFRDIVERGQVKILKEAIRRTGAGIPLDDLVKKSGVEVKARPRYYQGLSVYGKKRYVLVVLLMPDSVPSWAQYNLPQGIAACRPMSNLCL